MKIFAAKNCNRLFIKCILYPSLLNAAFYLTAHFLDLSLVQCGYLTCLKLLCCIFLAWAMHKASRETVLREPRKRKVYAALAFILILATIHSLFFGGDLFIYYSYFEELVYHRIGYAHMETPSDFITVALCLSCVFFYKFRWLEYIQDYFHEWKAEFLHK